MSSKPVHLKGTVNELNESIFPNVNVLNALKYCELYLDQMWAARIVGELIGCDFRDAKEKLARFKLTLKENQNG